MSVRACKPSLWRKSAYKVSLILKCTQKVSTRTDQSLANLYYLRSQGQRPRYEIKPKLYCISSHTYETETFREPSEAIQTKYTLGFVSKYIRNHSLDYLYLVWSLYLLQMHSRHCLPSKHLSFELSLRLVCVCIIQSCLCDRYKPL